MEDKDQRIQELEQQLEQMQQKVALMEGRQKRNRRRTVLIAVGGAAVLIVAAVAAVFIMMSMDKESPTLAESMLQAIVDGDVDGAYALFYPNSLDREEFEAAFDQMRAYWFAQGGQDTFTVRRVRWSMNANPASSRYESEFLVRSGDAQFDVQMVRVVQGESAGAVSFHFS